MVIRRMAQRRKRRTTIHLPEEIMEEILYNLPTKSLLRFKCVSKSWLSFISSKAFIKEHLKRSTAKYDTSGLTDLTHHKLLFTYKYTDQNQQRKFLYSLGSSSLRNEPKITPTFHDNPMLDEGCMNIMGSCNGMILICYNMQQMGPLILWNPSTRKYRILPSPLLGLVPQDLFFFGVSSCSFVYGLGYDESNNEYKVICIRDANLEELDHYETQVYSSKTDSWKEIESFNKRFQSSHPGKFLNGRLHWLARFPSSRCCCDIISLDLVEEKYQYQYQTLSSYCIGDFRSASLVELGGYLGLTSLNDDWDINVWVMKEYGARESWTKIWTLSDVVDDPSKCLGGGPTTPLCWRKNGDIVVVSGDDVFVCNGKNIKRRSRVCMPHDIMDSILYVESLVSPSIDEQYK